MKSSYDKPVTPFPTFGYFGPGYFCDREEELKALISCYKGNQPVLLSGIRRLGKTGLLHHFIHHQEQNEIGIYVDLQDASNIRDSVSNLSQAILKTFHEENKYKKLWDAVKKLRPTISFDEFSGQPQVSLSITNEQEAAKSLSSLLDGLSSRPEHISLIFDEFQQVVNFDDTKTESLLRSEMQKHPKLHYIFSGSKTRLLSRIFNEAERPFYGMVQTIPLEKLDPEVYQQFIIEQFEKHGKWITPELAAEVVRWTASHTYYTQLICNQLFLTTKQLVTDEDLKGIKERIIKSQSQDFFQIKDLLSPGQWNLLVAVSKEERLYQPNAQKIVEHYKLGNTTGTRKALDVLIDKQLISTYFDEEGDRYYETSHPFLANWIRSRFR